VLFKGNLLLFRFNAKLNAELPMHPTLFRFMHALRSTVILDGVAIVVQAQSGNLSRKPVDKARQHLLKSAQEVETAYLSGEINAQEVLMQGASHFENEKLVKYLTTVPPMQELEEEEEEQQQPPPPSQDELPDLDYIDSMDFDDRQAVLNANEGLQDVDDEPWITTVWPSAAEGKFKISTSPNYEISTSPNALNCSCLLIVII